MMRMILVAIVALVFVNTADAQRRGRYVPQYQPQSQPQPQPQSQPKVVVPGKTECDDALDEVNAKRATRGLRPFVRDEGLTKAAYECSKFRALYRLFGHTNNDFQFVPRGTTASSAGCAAYEDWYGWMSCCMWESYTYGGAAWVRGADGKRYMHLFVR